jgi:hypothetical protein
LSVPVAVVHERTEVLRQKLASVSGTQTSRHPALGKIPWQFLPDAHVDVDATRQPAESLAQDVVLAGAEQKVPSALLHPAGAGEHLQMAVPVSTSHFWDAGHFVTPLHAGHTPAITHSWIPPPEHCLAPTAQVDWHMQAAVPAPEVQVFGASQATGVVHPEHSPIVTHS